MQPRVTSVQGAWLNTRIVYFKNQDTRTVMSLIIKQLMQANTYSYASVYFRYHYQRLRDIKKVYGLCKYITSASNIVNNSLKLIVH